MTLIEKAQDLILALSDPANLALRSFSSPEDKVQYTHEFQGKKKKGGKPPVDFYIVDLKIDLEIALKTPETEEYIPLYFRLIRLL